VREPEIFKNQFPKAGIDICEIKLKVLETLGRNIEEWSDAFNYSNLQAGQTGECAIYLTSWVVHNVGLARLNEFVGDRFMKPHPYIKSTPELSKIQIISASAPAELVVMDLLTKYTQVTVFHHGSSCERYVDDERVVFVRL